MNAALAINHPALIEKIRLAYELDVARLVLIPRGHAAYCYRAECHNGNHYFVKLLRPTRQGRAAAARLGRYLPLTWNLYARGAFRNVPYPVQTRRGGWQAQFGELPIVVHNYIEGVPLDHLDPPPAELAPRLARCVAGVHASATRFKHDLPPGEASPLDFIDDLRAGLDALAELPPAPRPGQLALKIALAPRRPEIAAHVARLLALHAATHALDRPRVLSHGALTRDNWLVSTDNELFILDWEHAGLYHPERDLAFFAGASFPAFLRAYRAAGGGPALHPALFGFYLYYHNLTALTDCLLRILQENHDDLQDAHDLAGLERGPLAAWPHLEEWLAQAES